ncbi:hypothetical protein PVK06_001948 [Gossypium arboreum]|uniref:Uncharacterized protein n=1 Tax=Gossypium arboreum TaxID=29729 RepID=A0ABR0R3G4_GOSAR|nr:hypothetical protein PVK06_001948 [Gossypium arboreum]
MLEDELLAQAVDDAIMVQDLTKASIEPMELPIGPITCARAKRFKEAVVGLIDRIWGEAVAGFIDQSWTCTPYMPQNLLQAQL